MEKIWYNGGDKIIERKKSEMEKAKIGLVSVTFRQLTPEEVIRVAQKAGLSGIEWGGDIHVPAGKLERAKEVVRKTREAGLEVTSYGSYFALGNGACDWDELERVMDTADALGTDVVRIWLKNGKGSDECKEEDYQAILKDCREAAERAEKRQKTVCLEFHNGTYNDGGRASLRLMEEVNSPAFKTYWQPLYGNIRNTGDIKTVLPYIVHTHIYHWIYGEHILRLPLQDNEKGLLEYAGLLGRRWYLLEFVRRDDPEVLYEDAETMRKIFKKAGLE